MKIILLAACCIFGVMTANAETFDFGSKHRPASATVDKKGGNLFISCRFTPLNALKNNPGRSAQYNDMRARSLCMKALKLYSRIPQDSEMKVSGLVSAGPHREHGSEVEYFFSIPLSGITSTPSKAAVPNAAVAVNRNSAPPAAAATVPAAPAAVNTDSSVSSGGYRNMRVKSSFRVIKYRKAQGKVVITSSKEYKAEDFPNQAAFDKFCADRFDSIAKDSAMAFSDINRHFQEALQRMNTDSFSK